MKVSTIRQGFVGEIEGLPPDLDVDAATFEAIRDAWAMHPVLVLRGLSLSPEQHIAFTRRLGLLHVLPTPQFLMPGHPEIYVVSNVVENGNPVGLRRAGEGWHTDGEEKPFPNAGSLLVAYQLPPERGDTLFADGYAAFAALPADLGLRIRGRRARFSRAELHNVHYPELPPLTEEEKARRPDVFHPLMRRHPVTGRPSLYIGRWAIDIEGLPPAEGRELVRLLQEFSVRPEFVYRHAWRTGDGVLWDNRCTQHKADGFDDQKYQRRMHRTTLEGDAPVMAFVS